METACLFSSFRNLVGHHHLLGRLTYLQQPTWIRFNDGNQGEENCHIIFRDVFIDWHCYTYIHFPFPNHSDICFGTIYRNQFIVAVAVLMAHKPKIDHSVDIRDYYDVRRESYPHQFRYGPQQVLSGGYHYLICVVESALHNLDSLQVNLQRYARKNLSL